MSLPRLIIVRKRAVKRILSWREFYRNVIAAISRIWIIQAAVILSPVLVPAAYAIWNWIIRRRLSQQLTRFGTGLFGAGSSPIQKTVVTIWAFHGKRCPGGMSLANWPGVNEIEVVSKERSSPDFSDFLLNLVFAGSAFEAVPCAKREVIEERITAIV